MKKSRNFFTDCGIKIKGDLIEKRILGANNANDVLKNKLIDYIKNHHPLLSSPNAVKVSLLERFKVDYLVSLGFAAARFYYQPSAVVGGFALSALLSAAGVSWQKKAAKVEMAFVKVAKSLLSPFSPN